MTDLGYVAGCELAAITRGRTRIAAGRRIARAGATGNAYEYQALLNCGWPPLGP